MRLLVSTQSGNNLHAHIHYGEPIQLRWNGWTSTTHILDRLGWKFSADEYRDDYSRSHVIHLAATDPTQYVVIAGRIRVHPEEFLMGNWQRDFGAHPYGNGRVFEMQQFTARDVFRTVGHAELHSYKQLTAVDVLQSTMATERQIRMDEFKFFKQITEQDEAKQDIFIPQKSVDELFNEILKIQFPQQQEIKKGLILPEAKPIIQAKIYSLAV